MTVSTNFVAPEPPIDPKLVSVLGTGPFAQVVARILVPSGARIQMLAFREDHEVEVEGVRVLNDVEEAVRTAGLLLFAVPAGDLMDIAGRLGPFVQPDQLVLVASRGATEGFRLPHQHIREKTCLRKIGVLGGPLHVEELAAGRRLNAIIAARFTEVITAIKGLTRGTPVSFHTTRDVLGVEIAGAIANVATIAAGMTETLKLGDTARGVLLAHGIAEARRLGVALGADPETFSGLAGLGELIPRSVRSMERHVELGRKLSAGLSLDESLSQVRGHVEGVQTAREAVRKAEELDLELPLVTAIAKVLEGGKVDSRVELEAVLARPLPATHRSEEVEM